MSTSSTSPRTIDAPLTTLAAGAAHDLRNVLFVIRAHCEHLIDLTSPGDERREGLEAIKDATDRGARLASEMVTAGRDQAQPRAVDVSGIVRDMEPLLRRMVGNLVTVTTTFAKTPWAVTANSVQIEQIVMNLAVNARDAMPDGGRLSIAIENRVLGGTGAGQPAHFVVISVTDTGQGIDPALQDRIFEPYFTTKGNQGTGVGLATVSAIALLHGGHVELESTPGAGTTMRVVLPRAAGSPPAAPVAPAAPEARVRVLLVENERPIREYLQRILVAAGYEVRAASCGAEALDLSAPPFPAADVLISDVNLPDIGGPAIASQLRATWPGLGLIFISGDDARLDGLTDHGRVPVLTKPFTSAELMSAVRTAAARPA